jgi:hypothetical protein
MIKRLLVLTVVLAAILAGIYLLVVFAWSYSSGERAGWVQKFSRKGWVCKTWEGELAMVSLPGSTPEKFYFTVRDDAVAAQVSQSVGQRVRLHYEQHRGLPGTCFGETGYWVDSVTAVPDAPLPGAAPASTPTPAPAPAPAPATAPAASPAPR